MTVSLLKKSSSQSATARPVFIDLADYPVSDQAGDKRIKVLRPSELADLKSIKSYILSRMTVIIDLTGYSGDTDIVFSLVRDGVGECGGKVWRISPTCIVAAPFDVYLTDGE